MAFLFVISVINRYGIDFRTTPDYHELQAFRFLLIIGNIQLLQRVVGICRQLAEVDLPRIRMSGTAVEIIMTSLSETDLVSELQGKLNVWFWNGVVWERLHWAVGVLGIAFSALSAMDNDQFALTPLFAVGATICFGILGFANPQKRSMRFFHAYRLLDTALREFKCGFIPAQSLLLQHRRAEESLNEADTREPLPVKPA